MDTGQDGHRTGWIQDRMGASNNGRGWMLYRRNAGRRAAGLVLQEGCSIGRMQYWTDVGHEG